jgi:hypothetical protein
MVSCIESFVQSALSNGRATLKNSRCGAIPARKPPVNSCLTRPDPARAANFAGRPAQISRWVAAAGFAQEVPENVRLLG